MPSHAAKLYTNPRGLDMRAKRLVSAAGYSGLLLCLLASTSSAQERGRQRAPSVRVYSENGAGVVSSYVRPAIHVSEDAYVFAVMMDLDGRIQVLHPDFPGIAVRIQSRKLLHLPNFFAGFNDSRRGSRYSMAGYNGYRAGEDDSRGTVIALASREPFNLGLIEADGDWNMSAIRRLIENRSPEAAAQSLARYLGAKGVPIGRDFMRFAGQNQSYYAYDGYNAYCDYGGYGYGYGYASGRGGVFSSFARIAELRAMGYRPVVVGYDQCGMPLIVGAPFARGVRPQLPLVRPPGDTTVFPKSRLPQGLGRRPTPEGIFPLPQRAELPQMSDVTITAPRGRRAEPREILDFRPQPGASSMPERARMPVDRTVPSRAEPVSTGIRPGYRPEPRVIAPSEPARAPERAREPAPAPAPRPVVHERPAQPSAPPPRPADAAPPPRSRPEPAPVPPPRR